MDQYNLMVRFYPLYNDHCNNKTKGPSWFRPLGWHNARHQIAGRERRTCMVAEALAKLVGVGAALAPRRASARWQTRARRQRTLATAFPHERNPIRPGPERARLVLGANGQRAESFTQSADPVICLRIFAR